MPASAPFLSRLAQRLLGHPRGGALAVVGQVGRAFRFSPKWPEDQWRHDAVGVVVSRIMSGEPIGVALHSLRLQAAALGQELVSAAGSTALKRSRGATEDLAVLWALHGNFSSFTLLGDPAVRLRTQLDRPYEVEPPQPAYELREPQTAAWIREPSTVPASIVALPATEAGGRAWDDLIGPFRSESGVARLLGGVSEDELARARAERSVLALKTADGAWVFPSFQFEEDGTRVAGLAPILAAFRPDEVDDWMVARWLVTPLKALAGNSVIDWLRAGREQSVVLALARHMAARFEC